MPLPAVFGPENDREGAERKTINYVATMAYTGFSGPKKGGTV